MGKLLSQLRDLIDHPLWRERLDALAVEFDASLNSRNRWLQYSPLVVLTLLLLWNWQLGIALLAGGATMVALYSLQDRRWHQPFQELKHLLSGPNAALLLAVGGGAASTLGTYLMVSIWSHAGDRWLATAIVGQGLVTLAILWVLLWQVWQRHSERSSQHLETLLRDMASPEALQRLVAVRQLQGYVQATPVNDQQTRLAVDYLQLVLDREAVPAVREALLDTLQSWSQIRSASPPSTNRPLYSSQ